MNAIGIDLRLRRLFNHQDDKTMVVAVDHGIEGTPKGLENPEATIRKLIHAGIQGILLNPGLLLHTAHLFRNHDRPAVIVSLDMYVNSAEPQGKPSGDSYIALTSVEDAVSLGADAVKVVLVFGQSSERSYALNLEKVAEAIRQAHRLGMPVMLETVVWGQALDSTRWRSQAFVGHMMRIGVELGADILKVPYIGPAESFAEHVRHCPVPVTLLGGPQEKEDDVVAEAEQAVRAGVRGFVYGRNIWQHADPAAMVARLLNLFN